MFAEARDLTDAWEIHLLARTCVFWRRGGGLEEAPVSLPGQRMDGSRKVQLCGPELAQDCTSTHQRSWSREGTICLCPWSPLSRFGPSPRCAGHGWALMCYPRGSWHGQPARPGATREEGRDRDRGSVAPWLAPGISLFFSCEAQGGVSAPLCGATLSPGAALWADGTADRPSHPHPLSLPGPCHSLPFQLSCWPMSLSSRIHCLVSL